MEILISGAAFIVSVISLVISIVFYYSGVKRAKRQATLDAFNLLQNQVLDEMNCYSKTEIRKITEDVHSEKYKQLSSLLARCEHFCVGANIGIYDRRIVKKLAGPYLMGIYNKVEPLIIKKREINKTEKHYSEFENLVVWLKSTYKK